MSNVKRETSISVTDLHMSNVNDSLKRLAISNDGYPYHMNNNNNNSNSNSINNSNSMESDNNDQVQQPNREGLRIQLPEHTVSFGTVFSIGSVATHTFDSKYNIIKEIGRGGFSVVYQCQNKTNNDIYAVKVIDLRPLRLRQRFNPSRLRREVDIMRRLDHPNIIKFIEVYETTDQLMMVMEYCPGDELFDVILARKVFSEEDAKPIFAQVCKAIYYLHSLNIIHRDVKPENVLVLHNVDIHSGQTIVKLLDFGLSKNAGGGSAAKTFVGTPCYLAPEVEYTSKGLGGTYGLPADCWSLGAVLYVMLVARFPEFEQDMNGKVVLRLPPALWDNVSSSAKDLIRSLMNTNPAARCTAANALQHPWLGNYRVSQEELTKIALDCYEFSQGLQIEEEAAFQEGEYNDDINASAHAMVLRSMRDNHNNNNTGVPGADMQLGPLLHLQRSIASCFEQAHLAYQDIPEVATRVRRGAALCRSQLTESTKMLHKVEQTATSVLNMFPDLELAVEEGAPELATQFFTMVRGWVSELRQMVTATQQVNKASMDQIQDIVEQSTVGLQSRAQQQKIRNLTQSLMSAIQSQVNIVNNNNTNNNGEKIEMNSDQILQLFLNLFGQQRNNNNSIQFNENESLLIAGNERPFTKVESDQLSDSMEDSIDETLDTKIRAYEPNKLEKIDASNLKMDISSSQVDNSSSSGGGISGIQKPMPLVISPKVSDATNFANGVQALISVPPSPIAASHLVDALHKLRQVDMILEQLSVFWANTEVVLDVLTKKGQHVEQFIGFANKPRLMARFRERMEEYKRFWEGMKVMCSNYVSGINQSNQGSKDKLYEFLKEGRSEGSDWSSSSGSFKESFMNMSGPSIDKVDSL